MVVFIGTSNPRAEKCKQKDFPGKLILMFIYIKKWNEGMFVLLPTAVTVNNFSVNSNNNKNHQTTMKVA